MPRSAVARPCRTTECVGAAGRDTGARRARTCTGRGTRARRVLAALGLAAALPVAAHAQEPTGGTSPTLPAPAESPDADARVRELAPPPTANLYGKPAPLVKRFACRSSCGAGGAARPGSLIRIRARNAGRVDEVVFLGADGDGDDTSVAPRRVRRRWVLAHVPHTAVTGALVLVRPDGTRSPASAQPLTVEPQPVDVPAGRIDAEVQGSKVFFGSRRQAELSYVVGGAQPASVQVELVRAADGAVVEQWTQADVQPGVAQTLRWDGTAGGRVQHDGLYQFRVTSTDAAGVRASSSPAAGARMTRIGEAGAAARDEPEPSVAAGAPGAFEFLRYRFPLLGAHHYGEQAAAFGGGRGHQGQDVFADCGTPIVAARGGIVKFRRFQSAAGHYLVIDGARTGVDFGYMHLREAALVEEGERVRTGQPVGFVGATGRASGCHLHFEEWSAPGWYDGGSAFDPMPDLRVWDAQS
jgi:murein DD-endopeptidase MepM/ murein hydrolase activator NlpD